MEAPKPFFDTEELSRHGRTVFGQSALSALARLISDLPAQEAGTVSWEITGSCDTSGERYLRVQAEGRLVLECQRCLEDLDWPIHVDRTLRVVDSEEEAEAGLADEDPEAMERIVGSRRLDALALVEDEIILALPYVAMHPSCSRLPGQDDGDGPDEQRPSPFAVLNKLRKS